MHQWDPTATAYRHPESERGGLYCGADGIARKPYPNRGYCYTAPRKVPVLNLNSKQVHICQTVLPGDEAMRIPNRVAPGHSVGLAVPGQEYWIDSGAHYYVNFPGTPLNEACVWGNRNKPSGNVSFPNLYPHLDNYSYYINFAIVGSLYFGIEAA